MYTLMGVCTYFSIVVVTRHSDQDIFLNVFTEKPPAPSATLTSVLMCQWVFWNPRRRS